MPYVHIDIDLAEFDDDELIDEIKSRGYNVFEEETDSLLLLDKIYHMRRQGRPYETELNEYILNVLGKVI